MKAVAYIRVSTEEQGKGDGPAGQRRSIQAWAKANNVTITEWIEDHGTSGSVSPLQRQKVLEAIKRAKETQSEGIVVDKADRWTRGGLEDGVLSRAQLAKDHRLNLHICDMPFGLDQLVGQIVLAIRDAMAAEWLRTHKERVKRGLQAAKRNGWKNGKPGRPPKPDLTPEELDACVHMLNDGTGWPTIAHNLSKSRGAFDVATVEKMHTKRVTETWLRRKLWQQATKNPQVLLALERRGTPRPRQVVHDSEGSE